MRVSCVLRLWAAVGGLALCAGCQSREEYPDRPITLVCPWSVGGGTDAVSRQVAYFLEPELGAPVNVVNATGGRGVTGHNRGLHARPDGYTVAMMTVELNMLHWMELTGLTYTDAAPLLSVNEDAAALFVRRESRWESLDELLQEVRDEPAKLTASGTAGGGIWHLALAGWLQSAGLQPGDVKWIPMNGAGPSLSELLSGGVDMVCCSLPEAAALFNVKEPQLRCLGVMSEEPVKGFETVPTFRQQGQDWFMVGWRGLAVPRETPPERIAVLNQALQRVVTGETRREGKTFPDFMAQQGFNNRWRAPDEFREFLKANDEKFGQLLTSDAFASLRKGRIGPMAFPGLLLAILGSLLLILIAGKSFRPATGERDDEESKRQHFRKHWLDAGLIVFAVVAFVLLLEPLGFVLTSMLLLLVLFRKFGVRWLPAAAITLLFVPGLAQVFVHVLRVPLPRGWLGW